MSVYTDADNTFVLNDGYRAAVIVNGIIGTVSTLAVSGLLLHLFSVSFISGRGGANKDERIFLRMHLGAFVVCLLLSDLIQGLSGMFQLVWAANKQIDAGPLCTAQAAMIMFGDLGTAFWNAVVAIHTFWTVVLGKRMSTIAVALLIATGWTLCVVLTIIGPIAIQNETAGPFYAIAGGWCFVTGYYKNARIYLHYVPMLLSAFIITVLYLLVAMVLFGVLVVDGNKWRLKAPPRRSTNAIRDFFGQFSWGRLHRPSANSGGNPNTVSHSSDATKSASVGRMPGSIRLASIPPRTSDAKATLDVPEEPSTATVQSIVITARPDTGSTGVSENTNTTERGRKTNAKVIGEPKQPAQGQTQMSTNQVSGRALQLKTLAIKMLWYPIVYLVLILPIAISRVDSNVKVSLSVMLGFMCLLWLMGTANTVIYVCTRRLGPTPWARRTASSSSRSRSKGVRTQEATIVNNVNNNPRAVAPVQIFVDQYTHHATDDQFIEIAREKSAGSSGPDTPDLGTMPKPSEMERKEQVPRDYRDSKVEFEFGANPRHIPRQGSLSNPSTNYSLPRQLPQIPQQQPAQQQQQQQQRQQQQQDDPTAYTYTLPRPIHPQQVTYQEPHPYSRAQSPTLHQPTLHQHRASTASFTPYYYEDDDDSLRTNSRTHSRKGSAAAGKGIGIGL